MEFAAELQASLREFTLAAACARIELPRSDLWRSHHSSQELRRHRRAPSPALDAQLAVELYEHDPALNILEKIDPRRSGNRDTWLVPQREPETLLNQARPVLNAIISLAPRAVSLPLQAGDYWLRVRRQLQSGEIARYGYFQGVALQQAPPLVYLVAPALRFHPATDDLLKCLSPELEVARVGLAESRRRGLRVVMRQ